MSEFLKELTLIMNDHSLEVKKPFVKWLSVRKGAKYKFDIETFNLVKLNDEKMKECYQIKISNRFATCENWLKVRTSVGL